MEPLVSVVIPTYNCQEYIVEAIESALSQTFSNLEILVIDDGSTDKTKERLGHYIDTGKIRYFYQNNKGPGSARNLGIKNACGNWIAFLDADDVWMPFKLELQMNYLKENPKALVLSTGMVNLNKKDQIDIKLDDYKVKIYTFEDMLVRNYMCTQTLVAKKEIFSIVGLFREDLKLAEDCEMWLRMAKNTNLHRIMLPTVYYRVRPGSLSAWDRKQTVKKYLDFLNKIFSGEYSEYKKRYLNKALSIYCFINSINFTDSKEYPEALKYLFLSIKYHPFKFPTQTNHRFWRIRRFRTICLDFLKYIFNVQANKLVYKVAISSSGLEHIKRGVEASAKNLAYGLKEKGVNVKLYKGSNSNGTFYREGNIEKALPCLRRNSKITKIVKKICPPSFWHIGMGNAYDIEQTSFAFFLLLEDIYKQYDIIHTKDPVVANVLNTAHKFGLIKSKVIFANGTEEPLKFFKKFNYVQHLAPYHLDEAGMQGSNGTRWFAIPNFVNVEKFKPRENKNLREKLGFKESDFVILTVSAIKRQHKRIDYLIKEVSKIKDNNCVFVVAGSRTDDTIFLENLGKNLPREKVKFLIDLPHEKMSEIYNLSDLFVLCSLKEMMPNALIEALASGLPCICNSHPVMEWIIGEGGECIDMTKEGELARTIDKYMDEGYRKEKGLKAREQVVKEFSKEVVVEQIIEMYREVLEDI